MNSARRWMPCACALFLAIFDPPLAAQIEPAPIPHAQYLVKNWSTVDGLPDTTVRTIVQGRDGYLWLGTAGGVSRFDGIRFRNFTSGNTPALISDVFDLAEDGEGRLWIATSHGLAVREAGIFRWVNLVDTGEANRAPVYSIGIDAAGRAWAHGQSGVYRHDGHQFQKIPLDFEALQFEVDPWGKVWIGGATGVHRWNGTAFEPVTGTSATDVMEVDARGRIWMLTFPNVLSVWEAGVVRRLPSPGPGWFQAVVALPSGDVWVGARVGSESVRYRGDAVHRVDSSDGLHGVRPIGFCEDRGGNLWMGLNRGGLYRLRKPCLTL